MFSPEERNRLIEGAGPGALPQERVAKAKTILGLSTPPSGATIEAPSTLAQLPLAADPNWFGVFLWVFSHTSEPASTRSSEAEGVNVEPSVPFEDLFLPAIHAAAASVRSYTDPHTLLLLPDAVADLQRSLLMRLAHTLGATLLADFELYRLQQQPFIEIMELPVVAAAAGRAEYDAYIDALRGGRLRDFFLVRPVAAKFLAVHFANWLCNTSLLVERLANDMQRLRSEFSTGAELGSLKRIKSDQSDPHDGGQTVAVLLFERGIQIVYKPRQLGIDAAWRRFLIWLAEQGAPIRLRAPKVIDCVKYGWVEWIQPLACRDDSEAELFFRSSGALLCVLNLLRGIDAHFENVVANGTDSILVDPEALFHPPILRPKSSALRLGARATAQSILDASVLSASYLPRWITLVDGTEVGIGALNSIHRRIAMVFAFENVNTDAMRLVTRPEEQPTPASAAFIANQPLETERFLEAILDGFEATYAFFCNHKELIAGPLGLQHLFRGCYTRILLRPTPLYVSIIDHFQTPAALSSSESNKRSLGLMSPLETLSPEEMTCIEHVERVALTSLDVPRFWARTDGTAIVDDAGLVCVSNGSEAGLARVLLRLDRMGPSDLELQRELISFAVAESKASTPPQSAVPTSRRISHSERGAQMLQFRSHAVTLGGHIVRRAIRSGGESAWIGAVPVIDGVRYRPEVLDLGLYAGSGGIAIFLAALWRETGRLAYRDLALEALAPWLNANSGEASRWIADTGLGLGSGFGATVYTLATAARLLEDQSLLDYADSWTTALSADHIQRDELLDLLGGTAGALISLLALYRARRNQNALDRAILCGKRLLGEQKKDHANAGGWVSIAPVPLTGLSHGAAGISLALLRLFRETGDQTTFDAAMKGIGYEKACFSPKRSNWPDYRLGDREQPVWLSNWCHGSAGIGLARLGALDAVDYRAEEELDAAVVSTWQALDADHDHLCCGNFGRIEFFLAAGKRLRRSELVDEALDRASSVCRRAEARNGFSWQSGPDSINPSLFTGVSGVGYELLRLIDPDGLPSLLLFD